MFLLGLFLFVGGISGLPWLEGTGDERIVGGVQVGRNELPYQVSLQRDGSHFCGGVIHSATHIITAAHCVYSGNVAALSVVAGEHSLIANDNTEQTRGVAGKVIHPQYFPILQTEENDIAILELRTPLTLSDVVAPLKLPAAGQDVTGFGTVSGWGRTSVDGQSATVLRKVRVPIMTDAKCREFYGDMVKDSMLCAGFEEGGKDSCQGDSGGPLAVGFGENSYLAGIVSWGYGCAYPENPGVYTEVSYFIDFIETNTRTAQAQT